MGKTIGLIVKKPVKDVKKPAVEPKKAEKKADEK